MALSPEDAARYVAGAAAGDRLSWERLVDAYGGLIWAIARNHRLSHGDASDVSQTTWLRLLENIGRISDPTRVGAWLATTARRECLRLQARHRRTVLVPDQLDPSIDPLYRGAPELDAGVLRAERDEAVRRALATLPPNCQELMQLLMLDPAPSYEEISAALGIPVGSIGPTRGRCLEKIRALVASDGIENVRAHSL